MRYGLWRYRGGYFRIGHERGRGCCCIVVINLVFAVGVLPLPRCHHSAAKVRGFVSDGVLDRKLFQ